MTIWHPIVEFLGAIVGVDPDDWPKGDEDALREYARQYDAIAAELRATVAGGCRETSTAIGAAWNGAAGRALAAQVLAYGTDKDFGGAESIAAAAADVAQYLRDQADTIVRTKVMIIAQIAVGILMFAIPAGKALSLGMRQAFRQALKDFIHNRAKGAIKEAVAALAARAGKTMALTPVKLFRGIALAGAGAGAYGLAPDTIAQGYGVLTGQSGRTTPDGEHADGWNWDETKQAAEVAAVATPIAIATSVGLGGLGGLATRNVGVLNRTVPRFLGRRAAGAVTMAVSMPAANSLVVTHKLPTLEEVWKSAVMGAAVPGGGSHTPDTAVPRGEPVEVAAVRNHSTIGGDHRPPDPPQHPVKPGLESSHATAETNATGQTAHVANSPSTGVEARTETGAVGAAQPAAVATAPEAIARSTTPEAATAKTPATEKIAKPEPVRDWTQRQEHKQEVQRRETNANAAHAEHEAAVEKARSVKETAQAAKHADKELKTAERVLQKHESKHGKADDSPRAAELRERVVEAQAHHKTAHEELTAARHAEAEVGTTKLAAETHRLSYLTAKLDYVMSRLSPVELRRLAEGKLDVLKDALPENLTRDEALQLSIHELIHRTDDGWGFALKSTQLHAELALREDLLVHMMTGEGKTAVAAVALGMIAADRPVHFMTSNRSLSAQAYTKFRKVLEPLGYDVVHVDPAVRYGKPRGRTVYVGDVASFGWAMGRGHRVPGKDVIVDEVDAVAVELAAQRYTHSSGAAGKASAKTEAQVLLAKWALDSGRFDQADLGLTSRGEPINGERPELTAEGRRKLAELTGVDPAARQFAKQVTRLENAARARWGLREGRDYIRATIGGKETVLIVSKHSGEPLVDRETLLEQRWTDVAQALEAQHGLEVRADPSHTSAITTEKLLRSYDHVSGMSGTAKQAEHAIRALYGKDKVGRVVEIDRFNDPKLESRPPQHFATIEEKYQAIVDQAIADMAKDGDPATGRPQAIVTEHNDEVALVERLLEERLGDLPGVRIEKVNAERMAGFIADRTFDAEMDKIWKQAGERGTITIGNKVLGRGIDIELHPDAFEYGDRPDADTRVFTGRNGREAVSGGLAVRVGFHDAESPRGTIQALNRAGRQGAPGEASLYASHQDELFRRHPDALEAAAAYVDSPTVASRNKYLRAVESAQLASQAATLSSLGVTHTTATTPDSHDDTARSRRLSDQPEPFDAVAYRRLSQAEQEEVRGIVGTLTANDPVRLEGLRPLLESPWLRSLDPERLLQEIRGWEGLSYSDVFGEGVMFGIGTADAPVPVPLVRPSRDFADAADLGDLESLPDRLTGPDGRDWSVSLYPDSDSNRQHAQSELDGLYGGYLTGFGPPPYGLVRVTVDGQQYVGVGTAPVDGGPIQAAGAAAAEAAYRRSRVTFRTAQQLDVFGRALIAAGYSIRRDLEYFVDDAGNFRPVGLAGVEELPADPSDRIAEHFEILAAHRRLLLDVAIDNGPVAEVAPAAPVQVAAPDLGMLRELPSYDALTADQQRRVVAIVERVVANDAVLLDGLRPLFESSGLRGLGPDGLLAEIEGWDGLEYGEVFGKGPALDVAVAGAPRQPEGAPTYPVTWGDATRLELLPAELRRLSSGGLRGSVASLGEYTGVFEIDGPDGRKWAVKLWPGQGFERQIAREFEGQRAAELTGYRPELFGLVKATIDGQEYAGVAMEPVPGGFTSTASLDPAVVAETNRWRAAVDFNTVRQLDQYLQRLLEAGYHVAHELQFFVDDAGRVHPIDLEAVRRLPAVQAAFDEMGPFLARSARNGLLAVAIENARSQQHTARARLQGSARPGMTAEAAQLAVDKAARGLRLPRGISLKFVVGVDTPTLVREHGIQPADGPRAGFFRMEGGTGVVYVSARDHLTADDVRATVFHEVIGHYGWRLFSPEDRADLLAKVHALRHLAPELSARIEDLYQDERPDIRDEEFLAALAEGGVPKRILKPWNHLLATDIGDLLHRLGVVTAGHLERARRDNELEPLYGILRVLVRAVRRNRPVFAGEPASTARDRRVHRDQPRGGAGSIHRSEFRGDGRRTPNPAAVWSAVERVLPHVSAAVGAVHDVRAIGLAANRLTITFWGGTELTAELKVAGDFTNAGPVRWERTAESMHWATITLSPRVRDEVVGRALAEAIAGVVAAYRGTPQLGRQAEVAYLVARIEQGEAPWHHRKELRLLLRHLGKTTLQPVHRTRIDELEDGWTDPAAFAPTQLPNLPDQLPPTPDPAVDRFVHGLFRHFAEQPDVSPERGHSVSRLTVLREQPLLRQFVNWYGPDKAAELGRLDADAFARAISLHDRQSVAAAFARLRALLQQDGRVAARQFSELANALGVVANDDLRAALPHDLATAVHALEPTLLQRATRAIDAGAKSIPGLRADLMFGFLETVPAGTASAAVLAGSGRIGLAAAVLTGAVVAAPLRTVVNRYVEAREEQVKSARRTYRRTLDESSRSTQRASLTNAIRTAHRHLQPPPHAEEGERLSSGVSASAQVAGGSLVGSVVGRGELAVPEVKVPALTTAWWTFPLRSSVPVAAAAIPMAMVVSPVVVGATIGLAVVVVGSAQYLFARHQATLDDERRTRDYQWRSWRQLVDELRSTADYLVRLEALGEQLGRPVPQASFDFEAPTDHTGRGVIPAKRYFAVRELLLGVVPMAHRITSVYVQQQLATSTAAVLEALARLGTIGAVSGMVEALQAEANRHAFDRRMHNWLELLRIEVQARADKINDPLLAQLDQLLIAEPRRTMAIPALPPWSPVLHSDREATTNRRWYAVGAAAIAGSGVGVAAWMVESFHLDPVYLWQAAAAGAFQPVTFYARYLRRRMRVKADIAERDRGAEKRAADELGRERAAAADAAHEVGRIEDAIAGRMPRIRPAATTELGLFIESERRDHHGSAELSRLLNELAGLDAERRRLLERYDNGRATELHELTGVLVAISTTLTQYADALHKLGIDPHIRLGGPQGRPVSDSVLHHDPIHPRNLSDLTWAPGPHDKPSVQAEGAALIAARIHLSTAGRYGPLALPQIRAHAATGKLLTDIAADVVSAAERKPANALKARVEFLRTLTADQARAVPGRLIQQEQIPVDWPTYARMRIHAIQQEQAELTARAAARTESGAEGNDRHTAIAEACTTAALQGDRACEAWQAFRDNPTAATLTTAKQAEALYEQRLAESLPSKDVLQTAIVSGDLPHLTVLTEELNHALSETGNTFRFTPELLHRTLRAETRPLLSPGGLILTVGNDPQADVSELTQFELTLDPNQLREVLDHPVKFEEGQLGQLVQGGTGLSTTTNQAYGFNGSLKLGTVLSALPDHNPLKAAAQIVSPSIEYSKNFGHSTTGGATEYGLPGSVEVMQGEILRFRSARPRWSWRMRTSAVGAWSEPHVVAGTTDMLDVGISHAYTVGPPKDTVTIAEAGGKRNTDLPEHVASRVDGLSELADRAVAGLRQRLGRLDRIGHDQLRGLLTEDAPGRLAEATRPGGLTRPITSGGRVVAYAQLETTAVWEQATLLGDSSKDHKIERLRVGFSGTSGGVTRSAGDSYGLAADIMQVHDLHGSPWDLGPSGKAGRSTAHDVSVTTGDMAIHPSVQRVQPTIGLKLRLEHRLTIHRVGKPDAFTLTTEGDAVLRMPENEAFRYGVPVPAAAIVRGDDGQPTYGKDERLVLRGDPQPQEQPLELPVWMDRIRGAGPALVQELTGADKVLEQFLGHLTEKGLIPDGDLGRTGRVLAASRLANLERVTQQLSRHRLETGYDIAAQEGILFRLDLHRAGRTPEQHTYRIRIVPGASEFVGLTTGETVVNLDIGSNTTGRAGSWSNSLPWQFKLGLSNKPQKTGQNPEGGVTGARTSLGRVISWAAGSTVNRVSLTESTAKVAVFEVEHHIVVTELTDESVPVAKAGGSARLSVDSEFCPTGADPVTAIDGAVDPLLLRAATFQAIDAGNPVERLLRVLPQLARADSSALHHLSAFLNPRNLAARPELLVAPYRTSLLVTPVPSNARQAIAQRGITSGHARLTVTATLRNLEYIGFGNPVNGEINLTLGSTTIGTGASTGGSVLVNGGDGAIESGETAHSGSLTGNRSTGRSESRTETQINGVERLVIRTGQHYQFVAGLGLTAQLQGAEKVQLPDGTVMLTIPERDVLQLYGRGKLALPAGKVAEVIERLRDGKLELDKRTAVSVLTRYASDAQDDTVTPLVRRLVGLTERAFSTPDILLPAAKYLAEQHVEVKLPQFYTTTMGAAMIDESSVQDPDGHETDLYREVLAALDDHALDDPVLTAGLRGDLAGLRWHGHVDDLISPRGFVTEYPAAAGRRVRVRINLKYQGPITMRGEANANALTILQIYNYLEQSRGVTKTTTYGGNAGGSFTADGPRDVGIGTDRSTSTTASSTEQNTRITRALWEPTKRVSRRFTMSIQIDDATSRNLTGELTLLVPPSVINPTPEQGPADRRTVTLPRGTVAEGTTAPTLFDAVQERLSKPDMLTKAGVFLHRTTLENVLSAATRMAAFERIASPDGYPLVQLPVPGHRSRMVALRVRAELSGMRLVAEDTTQLAQIDRQQRTTQLTTSSTRMLPAARSLGTSNAVGVGAGASAGDQAGEKVNDMTGHRKETSMYERGPVVTVQVDVRYLLEYARLHLARDGGVRTGPTDTASVDGTAYLTMYRHEYDELCRRRAQSS